MSVPERNRSDTSNSGVPTATSIHRVLRNSTFNLAGQGLLAVFNLGAVFVLARVLGRDGLGTYFFFYALILVVQLVTELGTNTVLTIRIARRPATWRDAVAEAAGIYSAVAAASILVFVTIGGVWSAHADDAALLHAAIAAGVACAAVQVQRYAGAIFRAFEQVGYENLGRVLQGALFVAFVLVLVVMDVASAATVLAACAASNILTAAFLLVGLQRRWHCLRWRLSPAVVKDWLGESVPLGLGDVVRRLTWQLDTVLLGLMQPIAVVGLYSVAYRPLGPLNWLPQAVMLALLPSLARMAEGDRAALSRTFATSVRLMWIISLPLTVALCISAEPVIVFLAGSEFIEAAVPMRILIWIAVLSFLSMQFRFVFTALGRQRLFAQLVIGVFILELILELILIPRWGYLGACTGSVVGEVLFTAIGLALCRRMGVGGIDWPALARATLAVGVMAALLWPAHGLPLPLLFAAVVATGTVYFGLCIYFGALRRHEVQRLYEALSSLVRPGIRAPQRELSAPVAVARTTTPAG